MMIDEIKKANMEALKNKDKDSRAAYSVVINKYNIALIEKKAEGKEMSDNDLVAIISKVIKELKEEKEGYQKVNNLERVKGIETQEEALLKYLPKMMSEEEIKADMGVVSKIARSL